MNEMTLVTDLKSEKTVTTKELAESLGVDVKTIQRAVDSLDINVERVGSSHTMVFNEAQATAIKIELQNHSKIAQNGFNTLTINNDVEMLILQKGVLDRGNQPYQRYCDMQYFRIIESKYVLPTGEVKISLKTVVYQRGLDFI